MPLFELNKIMTLVKLANDVGFPNFPLATTEEKAEALVARLANRWWEEEERQNMIRGLLSKYKYI